MQRLRPLSTPTYPQRTGSAVTAPAADHRHLSTHRQVPRPLRLSLSLGSLAAKNSPHRILTTMQKQTIRFLFTILIATNISQSGFAAPPPALPGPAQAKIRLCLEKALQDVKTVKDEDKKAHILLRIGVSQANLGDFPGALETVKLIESQIKEEGRKKSTRGGVLNTIIGAQARKGDVASALRTANAIQGGQPEKDLALQIIATGQAESDVPGALRTANGITDPNLKGGAFAWIARAQIEAGDVAGAKLTAEKITNGSVKENVLKDLDPDVANQKRCHGYLDLAQALLKGAHLVTW